MTPHNEANENDFAKVVLMSGDPLRVKYIAENFMNDVKLINSVRGMLAYTGKYKGKDISVMGHGMGIPSIGIYSYELYKFYNVETIIRMGSCGGYVEDLNLKDIILVDKVYSESTFGEIYSGNTNHFIDAKNSCNTLIAATAKEMNLDIKLGNIHCSDTFYSTKTNIKELHEKYNCLAVEMETFGLFNVANELNKKASCILTVSDLLIKHENLSPEERQKNLNNMIKLGLETAIKI